LFGKLILVQQYGAENIQGDTENLLFDEIPCYCTAGGTGASLVALDINTGKDMEVKQR